MNNRISQGIGLMTFIVPMIAFSAEVMIPRGTKVFGELEERVTSNARRYRVGREVDGHVWKDVIVNGHTVIPAGSPIVMRISKIDSSSVGGQGGSVEIMAVSVISADGSEISLDGGYGQDGNDRYGLTRALSYILWPTVFLPGRKAVLDVGTVFDASIPADTYVTLPDDAVPTLNLTQLSDLTVEILYDDIDQREGRLPLQLTLCNSEFVQKADITAVNEQRVRPIMVSIISRRTENDCYVYTARVLLEDLTKHFTKGINRFSVSMADVTTSVILNVEM